MAIFLHKLPFRKKISTSWKKLAPTGRHSPQVFATLIVYHKLIQKANMAKIMANVKKWSKGANSRG